jgi:hypothetical protein
LLLPHRRWGGGPGGAWWRGSGFGPGGSRQMLCFLRQITLHHPSGGPPPHRFATGRQITRPRAAAPRRRDRR